MKQAILDIIEDAVGEILYYGRKEDEEIGIGEIEKAVESGEITIDEITERFKRCFIENIRDPK